MVDSYPLSWPQGWPRTEAHRRLASRFNPEGLAGESARILNELRLLGARYPVISTNVELRKDGLPYSSRRPPEDPGVAVYFELDGQPKCIPLDRWQRVEENARAIWKCVEAMRGLDRWGVEQFVSAAFTGFRQLPSPDAPTAQKPWWQVLGFENPPPNEYVLMGRFRELAKKVHPDNGGSNDDFILLLKAKDEGLRNLGVKP